MARNDVIRVSATNTTKAEKNRRADILARAEAEANAEAKRLSWLWNLNNQSAEAMAMRDGPIESLTPEVLGMIAMDVPAKWATNAAWNGLKKVLGFAGVGAKKGGQLSLADLDKIYKSVPDKQMFGRKVSEADLKAFDALKKDISDWYTARRGVIGAAGRDTGIPDTLDGFLAGVRNAKLVDASGTETLMSAMRSGGKPGDTMGLYRAVSGKVKAPSEIIDPILYDTAGEVAIEKSLSRYPSTIGGIVYHEVGGHAASRGAKATTLSRAIKYDHATAARFNRAMNNSATPLKEVEAANAARQKSFDRVMGLMKGDKSSAERMVELVREKHGIKVRDPEYWDKPSEVMSRVWELRKRTGVSPETSWTPDFVARVRRTGDLDDLALSNWTDEALAELANRMPAVAAPLAAAEAVERRQAAKGGNAPGESKSSAVPKGHNPALDGYSGPRVVINPQVMKDGRDALCVAFNESFRIIQEINGFDPVAEPTEKQRAFFADTAYRDDERMLRRTILSRICTFDTSVTDPTDEQLQEAVEFLDTVLEIGAPQNQWEQRAVERIRTAISKALESGERVPASQAPVPEGSPETAAGGAGSSAGGVPEDEEKDSGAEFRENAQAQIDEAAKLAQEGPTAEDQKVQAMADAAGKAAGNDPFGKSAEMKAAAQEAGLKADIAEAQKPENLMQKNGHYVDAQGRVISERAAKELAEQGARNAEAHDTNDQQQAPVAGMDAAQNSPRTASERIGITSGIKAPGGRELTAGEAAWQARKQASTEAWMRRTGRSGDGVADALAQRDELSNNLRQSTQVDSGRRDALGRKLDDRGRVIA